MGVQSHIANSIIFAENWMLIGLLVKVAWLVVELDSIESFGLESSTVEKAWLLALAAKDIFA